MSRLTLTALAVALTAAFLGGAGRTGDGGTPDSAPPPAFPPRPPAQERTLWEQATDAADLLWLKREKIPGWLKGRVLGSLIQKGMTAKQVEQLLGEDPLRRTLLVIEEPRRISRVHYYPELGLSVFTTEQAGVLQVDEPTIHFIPLLD
jgi:hypothetical protein